jgi:hypothetical protein
MELALKLDDAEIEQQVKALVDQATEELPSYIENEDEARAWVSRRVLELGERGRRMRQTVQALLGSWVVNGQYGQIWMNHPDRPPSFRAFLESVGSGVENHGEDNRLSPSVISDVVAIAEVIVPFCADQGIGVSGYITTQLWTKFREAIPPLRKAAESNDAAQALNILADVKALPNRDAVRAKYRKPRSGLLGKGDTLSLNGHSLVIISLPTELLTDLKRVLGRYVDWQVIAAQQSASDTSITVKVKL